MATTFAAATLALAPFANFDDAVIEFETCQAGAAYSVTLMDSAEVKDCSDLYAGIKLEFVDPEMVTEYETIRREGAKNSSELRRMQEINLIGYAGWMEWKKEHADFHQQLVQSVMTKAKAIAGM